MLEVCLVGNPNCGKTSLFNALTGTYQKVGNWNGVTTEVKKAFLKNDKSILVVDLPGIYSFNAISQDEKIVVEYLKSNKPSVIINVVDPLNLKRSFALTSELCKLNVPIIIAVNFYDEIVKNNLKFHGEKIEEIFGCRHVLVSAKKKVNIGQLLKIIKTSKTPDKSAELFNINSQENLKIFLDKKSVEILKINVTRGELFTQKADRILLNKYFGIPIFVLVIFINYYLSFVLSKGLIDKIDLYFNNFCNNTATNMLKVGLKPWIVSLVVDSVMKGFATVLSFVPQILLLFLFMTIIEESGYASRISFLLDRFFRAFGLGGKSVIPLVLSCGCTVTGLTATRTIDGVYERRRTAILSPFLPCGAKTIVFAWFSNVFFNGNPLITTSMYFMGILFVAFFGKLLTLFERKSYNYNYFLVELPTLRMPSVSNVMKVLYEKFKDFIYKTGTIIFGVSVVLWMLTNFGVKGYSTNIENSFLYNIGNIIKYIFVPLGFGNWQSSVAIISGIFAKEAVIETFELIAGGNVNVLFSNVFSVYSFMCFILLSPPCLTAILTMKKELKSKKWFVFSIVFQFVVGYVVALIINLIGKLFCLQINLIISILVAIIIIIVGIISIKYTFVNKCLNCSLCSKGDKPCRKNLERNTTL
ncbi:MAG: ferrous iron transporter B [Clostridia bacterium]|nr:ferrous iron transporter B [Clostridia bacterium]